VYPRFHSNVAHALEYSRRMILARAPRRLRSLPSLCLEGLRRSPRSRLANDQPVYTLADIMEVRLVTACELDDHTAGIANVS
jgi:hypothetical protein